MKTKMNLILFISLLLFISLASYGQDVPITNLVPQNKSTALDNFGFKMNGNIYGGLVMTKVNGTIFGDSNSMSLYTNNNRDLTFYSGTGNILFFPNAENANDALTGSGNLGIGHNNPDMKLDVRTKDAYISRFHHNGSSTLSGIRIGRTSSFGDLIISQDGFGIGTSNNSSGADLPMNSQSKDDLNFFISNTSGNIGMGTANPDSNLEIKGSRSVSAKVKSTDYKAYFTVDFHSQNGGLFINHRGTPKAVVYYDVTPGKTGLRFFEKDGNKMIISNGNVGIGTDTPTYKLEVNGTFRSKEVICEASPWPDYVFEKGYDLKPLAEVGNYISKNGHLPNIPSAKEVEENGIKLGEMNANLLEKIEELTLYTIDQEEKLDKQEKLINELLKRLETVEGKMRTTNE